MMRRIVYRHTAGPYVGLRQILGVEVRKTLQGPGHLLLLHIGEWMALDPGPMPDVIQPIPLFPDMRMAKGMRLRTSDKYVLYQEMADGA